VTRAVELYRRKFSRAIPRKGRRCSAREEKGRHEKEKRGEASSLITGVLEPVYEATGEWQRLISVLDVQPLRRRSVSKVVSCPPGGKAYEESLDNRNAAFDGLWRARSACDNTKEDHAAAAGAAGATEGALAGSGAHLRRPSSTSFWTIPSDWWEIASGRRDFEIQLEDVDSAVGSSAACWRHRCGEPECRSRARPGCSFARRAE